MDGDNLYLMITQNIILIMLIYKVKIIKFPQELMSNLTYHVLLLTVPKTLIILPPIKNLSKLTLKFMERVYMVLSLEVLLLIIFQKKPKVVVGKLFKVQVNVWPTLSEYMMVIYPL